VNMFFKKIAVFSLWLAGFIIIAHLVTPHDHHSDCSVFNMDACHTDNIEHPFKSHGFPFHCHALNDLTFEKTSPVFIVYNDIPTCHLFILNNVESSVLILTLSGMEFENFQKSPPENCFLRLTPLRAPPTMS
jgi:hypothetical protein